MSRALQQRETFGERCLGDPAIERNRKPNDIPTRDDRAFAREQTVETIPQPTRRDWQRGEGALRER